METAFLIHYITIALVTALSGLGVGISQGLCGAATARAMNLQPEARGEIMRTSIFGVAFIETGALIGFFVSILLLFKTPTTEMSYYGYLAEIGVLFAIGIPGLVLGLIATLPASQACMSIARQPLVASNIMRFMLILLSFLQTPLIFGLIIALLIKAQANEAQTLADALRLISGGAAIGFGSIGPSIGIAYFAQKACEGIGKNQRAYPQIFSFTLISQAFIETSIIFALVIAIMLVIVIPAPTKDLEFIGIMYLASAIATGLGTLGTGIGSGYTAGIACTQIAEHPEQYPIVSRLSLLAQAFIETCTIYPIIIALFLIFW